MTVRLRPLLVLPSTRTPSMTDTIPPQPHERARTLAVAEVDVGQRRFISSPWRAPSYATSRRIACNRCVKVVARNTVTSPGSSTGRYLTLGLDAPKCLPRTRGSELAPASRTQRGGDGRGRACIR